MSKELLFSVTKKDLDIQFTRGSGAGGQNRNKVSTACRITHRDSGAVGYSETYRTQLENKKAAFERLIKTDKFKTWHKIECSKRLGTYVDIDQKVDQMMQEKYLKVEYLGEGVK